MPVMIALFIALFLWDITLVINFKWSQLLLTCERKILRETKPKPSRRLSLLNPSSCGLVGWGGVIEIISEFSMFLNVKEYFLGLLLSSLNVLVIEPIVTVASWPLLGPKAPASISRVNSVGSGSLKVNSTLGFLLASDQRPQLSWYERPLASKRNLGSPFLLNNIPLSRLVA